MAVVAPKAIDSESRRERPAGPFCKSTVAFKAPGSRLLCGELAAGGRDDVGTGVGVTLESPTALG